MPSKKYEEKIKELIKMVEKQYPKAKKTKEIILINALRWTPFGVFLVLTIYVILITLSAALVSLTFSDIVEYLSLVFSWVALFFALYSYSFSFSDVAFHWAIKSKTENILKTQKIEGKKTEILIRALVKMKAMQEEVSLLDIFEINPRLFNERKLVEFLYMSD